jgi:glycine amidinotransferase
MINLVNSWNEWDPLEEVIVGSARGAADMGFEPSLSPYFPVRSQDREFRGRRVDQSVVDDAERQLDNFANLLDRLGVIVRRPAPIDHVTSVKTPDWEVAVGRASACPRDLLLIIGDEIIEAPMAQRARYFEFRAYRSLIKEYFRRGARWTTAPKPTMSEALYNDPLLAEDQTFDFAVTPFLTEFEPAFDAACFSRCGRDIFWQPDLVSNSFGAEWLQRHLGPTMRLHCVRFSSPTPTHIDTTLVPIRPGLVLTNPERRCLNNGLELFRTNDWQIVEAPPSVRSGRAARDVSNWISLNILMLDERTAVVEEAETSMIHLLSSLGCEVIPCPFDRVYAFGGGFHCCTTDIRRQGALQSYFPTLDSA